MKNLLKLFISAYILLSSAYSQFIPIDSIRVQDSNQVSRLLGQTVTTRGVVTTHREFGLSLVYFQVRTAGCVGFDTTFSSAVKRGDSIEVTGVVSQFNGLTELNPVSSVTVLDTGKTVNPTVATCTQIRTNGELYEGKLIKILNVTAVHTTAGGNVTVWTVSGSGTNYRILVGSDSCDIRIYATSEIANQPIIAFPFNVVAECSQFDSSIPYTSGYQILPRRLDDFSGATVIQPSSNIIPDKFFLHQNYPNPFNPKTIINYELPVSGQVSLKVYNILGMEVASLVNQGTTSAAGIHTIEFDGSNLSSGIYFYSLSVDGNLVDIKKMSLLK